MREYELRTFKVMGRAVVVEKMPTALEANGLGVEQRYYYSVEGFGGGYERTIRNCLDGAKWDMEQRIANPEPLESIDIFDGMTPADAATADLAAVTEADDAIVDIFDGMTPADAATAPGTWKRYDMIHHASSGHDVQIGWCYTCKHKVY